MSRYSRIRIFGGRVYEHRAVWVQHNGPIPRGYVIHHADGDVLNNNINNLKLVQHGEHGRRHTKGRKHRKPRSLKTRLKLSASLRQGYQQGRVPWNKGKTFSYRQRAPLTAEHKAKLSAIAKRREKKKQGRGPAAAWKLAGGSDGALEKKAR